MKKHKCPFCKKELDKKKVFSFKKFKYINIVKCVHKHIIYIRIIE